MDKQHRILMDTHVWLWFVLGEDKLHSKARTLIAESAGHSSLYLSSISLWEASMLEAKGRLVLSKECFIWIKESLAIPGLTVVPITPEIAVDSTRLPDDFHGDPADRIIVATARNKDAVLLTRDGKILEYGKAKHLKCLEA